MEISDPVASQLISESAAQPGYPLLRYKKNGHWQDLLSDDVNEHLQGLTGLPVSAKDFRTWTGTRLAMQLACEAAEHTEAHPSRKFDSTLVKLVAGELGNTPAICKKYYIHPAVLSALTTNYNRDGSAPEFTAPVDWLGTSLTSSENAVLALL
ncbi:hypothetical protein [Alteromonas lipolytica]|uniref:DNA topoisomerase I catalytic core eukaryotic-type domain-containing protein n=1 Tax=Alteromonas lipolytica TaxID=1856405 RepID=A0A1E8FBU8_9ALTE|nr:hypothetical protein [Alteromonas lipolytica]OFI32973.1 hypothetical protein BFC17_01480 [Alteromonas lipolytica]